jgi:hypothetical protein
VFAVAFQDVDRSRERWKETAMGKAWGDVAVDYWRSQQMDPVLKQLLERIGAPGAADLLGLISGGAVAAVEIPSQSSGPAQSAIAYAFLDFGKNAEKARSIVSSGALGYRDTRTSETKGPEIAAHGRAGDAAPVLFSAWVGDTWIVSSSEAGIASVLGRREGKKGPAAALRRSEIWRRAIEHFRPEADAFAFCDVARVYRTANERLQSLLEQRGLYDIQDKTQALAQLLGIDSVELTALSVEMRGAGFYSLSAVESKKDAKGLLHPWRTGARLETPRWVTTNLSAFSASRAMPPIEIKDLVEQFADVASPQGGKTVDNFESSFQTKTSVDLGAMLARAGTERAILSGQSTGLPDLVILWESSDPAALAADVAKCLAGVGWRASKGSMAGMPYETISSSRFPMSVFVAPVEKFVMLGTSSRWLSEFAQRRDAERKKDAKIDPALPAGPDSLLPLLEEPFSRLPRRTTVVGRSYSNPGPALSQINAFLPLAVPMINLQLQRNGIPGIPSWVVSALPPIPPFANNVFATVSRVEMKEGVVVTEKYSAFDPVFSPLGAAALVVGGKYYLQKGE